MYLPRIQGLIERRILVNYRVEPVALARLLPVPFRPQIYRGHALAGICLIRLNQVRPRGCPAWLGLASENAAHRAAVEWDEGGRLRTGVFIFQRHTNSRWNVLAGGRLFPGVHGYAEFRVDERHGRYAIGIRSDDGAVTIDVAATATPAIAGGSLFATLDDASMFFRETPVGYSAARRRGRFQALELGCDNWSIQALEIECVRSSFFEDSAHFRPGAVEFDSALLMRDIPHVWRRHEDLCTAQF